MSCCHKRTQHTPCTNSDPPWAHPGGWVLTPAPTHGWSMTAATLQLQQQQPRALHTHHAYTLVRTKQGCCGCWCSQLQHEQPARQLPHATFVTHPSPSLALSCLHTHVPACTASSIAAGCTATWPTASKLAGHRCRAHATCGALQDNTRDHHAKLPDSTAKHARARRQRQQRHRLRRWCMRTCRAAAAATAATLLLCGAPAAAALTR
jgi:hypothetical protein